MTRQCRSRQATRPLIAPTRLALAVGLAVGAVTDSALSAIDPEADKILQSMSTHLAGLSALSVDADADNEIIDLAGQKLQFSSSLTLTLQRPGKIHITRHGPFAESQLFFDAQTLTLSVEDPPIYAQIEAPGDVDNAVAAIRSQTGLDAPAGDLFYAGPYAGLPTDVVSGAYITNPTAINTSS